MVYNIINISNRYNFHPEYPISTTSKVVVYFELQFIRVKRDVKKLFD